MFSLALNCPKHQLFVQTELNWCHFARRKLCGMAKGEFMLVEGGSFDPPKFIKFIRNYTPKTDMHYCIWQNEG